MSTWRKSTKSIQSPRQCVEVARSVPDIRIRDSKNPTAGYVRASSTQWSAFLAAIKAGQFDR